MRQTNFMTALYGALLIVSTPTATARQCYAPDGTPADERILPCIGFDGVDSMCCRMNDTFPDTCLSNGLCYWAHKPGYYRDYCTDQNWDSPNCLSKKLCDESAGGNSSYSSPVTLCPGGDGNTFCCGETNACCTEGNTFTLAPTLVDFAATATATATVTATSDSNASRDAAIGAGVGVPLGVLALAMLGAGFWWGKRNTSAQYNALKQNHELFHTPQPSAAGWNVLQADSLPVNEMDSAGVSKGPIELPVGRNK